MSRPIWRRGGRRLCLPALVPVFEPGPFPIRLQTAADLEAVRFDLLAWADPHRADGTASPFWVQSEMVEAVPEPDAEPLVAQVAADGGSLEGLRLANSGRRDLVPLHGSVE